MASSAVKSNYATRLSNPRRSDSDCACGSGIQIAAYSEILKRPIIGVELNESRARASAVNFRTVFTERGDNSLERIKNSVFVAGDGRDGSAIMSLLKLESESVAFLHLDPARPRNSRAHALSEMAPRLDEVFAGWKPHIKSDDAGPAIFFQTCHPACLEIKC